MTDRLDRRAYVSLLGSAGIGVLAGCAEEDPTVDQTEDDVGLEPENSTSEDEDVDVEEDPDPDLEAWEEVDEIRLDATSERWTGVAPELIEDEENPTLVLFEGREYTLEWENVDGKRHNFAVLDDGGETFMGTEFIEEEGATESFEFEPLEEMSDYVCEVHSATMAGPLVIETAEE